MTMICTACFCAEEICTCEESVLVESENCDNCGTICETGTLDYIDLCEDCSGRYEVCDTCDMYFNVHEGCCEDE